MIALAPCAGSALLALALAAVVGYRGGRAVPTASFALAMVGLAVTQVGQALMTRGIGGSLGAEIGATAELVTLPAWVVFAVTFGAPDARAQVRRWSWAVGLTGGTALGLLGWRIAYPMVEHGHPSALPLTALGRWTAIFALLVSVFVLFQLESRLRGSAGSARASIKHFVLALLGIFAANVFGLSQQILYGQVLVDRFPMQSGMILLALGLMTFALVRHRLLAVDVFMSRQAVYSFIAVGVIGAYLLGLGLASETLTYFGLAPDLFVAALVVFASAMALVIGLLSETVRRWMKRLIGTHFYRSQYDYRREWAEFTSDVSRAGRPESIPERILGKVTRTIGTSTGVLWLRGPAGDWRLAASVGGRAAALGMSPEALVRSAPRGQVAPFRIATEPRMRAVPLELDGDVGGLLVIGPPSGGELTFEDDELLATFATQAATVIFNARLTEQLARARELEALHRVSTFVLHDLKNCVSMLSLVARNAESHGQNPEFQRDAFRTVADSVRQMQDLMGKLSDPPPLSGPGERSSRLNKRIEEIVARVRVGPKGTVDIRTALDSAADLVTVPGEALHTILSNLLVNAVEALDEAGRIEVRTSRDGAWVTLTVADTGCGMSVEFVRDQLFVPLRTTKASGLGIGLYQVKSLLDALGGRIRVESIPGRGTTFWVELPAESERR
jgi:hypothetical protein